MATGFVADRALGGRTSPGRLPMSGVNTCTPPGPPAPILKIIVRGPDCPGLGPITGVVEFAGLGVCSVSCLTGLE